MPQSELEHTLADRNYYLKSLKFCKKLLNLKFNKNSFNKSISKFSIQVYERFNGLERETKALLATTVTVPSKQTDGSTSTLNRENKSEVNKELDKKAKKDFKSLNQQKLKFISDLLKDLANLGLSYRKGNVF